MTVLVVAPPGSAALEVVSAAGAAVEHLAGVTGPTAWHRAGAALGRRPDVTAVVVVVDDTVAADTLTAAVRLLAHADVVAARRVTVFDRLSIATGPLLAARAPVLAGVDLGGPPPGVWSDAAASVRSQRLGARFAWSDASALDVEHLAGQPDFERGRAWFVVHLAPETDEGAVVDAGRAAARSGRALVRRDLPSARRSWERVGRLATERIGSVPMWRPLTGPSTGTRALASLGHRVPRTQRRRAVARAVSQRAGHQPLADATLPPSMGALAGFGVVAPLTDARILGGGADLDWTLEMAAAWLHPGDHVVDVGGHIGVFTLRCALALGDRGRITVYEPSPRTAEALHRNLDRHVRPRGIDVTVRPAAAGAETGEATFFVHANALLGGLRPSPYAADVTQRITVPIERIDDVVERPVALLKIDVEGAELDVLAGAVDMLRGSPEAMVIAVLNLRCLSVFDRRVDDLVAAMEPFGELWVADASKGPVPPAPVPWRTVADDVRRLETDGAMWYANLVAVPAASTRLAGLQPVLQHVHR